MIFTQFLRMGLYHMNTFNDSLLDEKKELDKLLEGNHPNSKEFISFLKSIAQEGSPIKQRLIGFIYFYGAGAKQNYFEARKWYQLAANQGDAESQHQLGWMFQKGKGTAKSNKNRHSAPIKSHF